MQKTATNNQGEPDAFTFASFSPSGITSDQYSFLDTNADDLLAKGSGGLRQMHNYVNINNNSMMSSNSSGTSSSSQVASSRE